MHRIKLVGLTLAMLLLVGGVAPAQAETRNLTILHTNDLHSQFLGFSPSTEYDPTRTGADQTSGGWARLATRIKELKKEKANPVLTVDDGDFTMGSLFHMLAREEAFELRLLKVMGYDVLTLGNHEFDLRPRGLARILAAAESHQALPTIVQSNTIFSPTDPADDTLAQAYDRGLVKPWTVVVKDGVKIGLFGMLGHSAATDSPFAKPVKFDDPLESARRMVRILKDQEKVDLVVCLSHGGLNSDPKRSEDEVLATQVPGLDVIISGHTHTKITAPKMVGRTIIVQAWCYGRELGVLDLEKGAEGWHLKGWRAEPIDARIKGDDEVNALVGGFEKLISEKVLAPHGLEFRQPIATTDFDLTIRPAESNLGELVADGVRWAVNQRVADPKDPADRVVLAVCSNGLIREDVLKGRTGRVAVCDLFRAVPLGIGPDDTMGYPLVSFFLTGAEIKKAMEVLTTIEPQKGPDYYLQVSGLRFAYNPNRMLFDRVTDVWLGSEEEGYQPLDCSTDNPKTYRVAANIYNAAFLEIIGGFTWHILDIVPKDRLGRPLADLKAGLVDGDRGREGVQELKEWRAVFDYVRSFADTNKDGLPEVPTKYRTPLGRILVQPSLNPYHLLRGGSYLTWAVAGTLLLVLVLGVGLGRWARRRFRSTK